MNRCRALIQVDGTNIRKKLTKAYQKALRDLDNSRQKLDQFHKTDLPEFTSWVSTRFGAQLTQVREIRQQIASDEELFMLVQTEAFRRGISCAKAYELIMKRREDLESSPKPADGDEEGHGPDGSGKAEEPEDSEGEEDPFEAFLRDIFEDAWSEEESWDEPSSEKEAQSAPKHGRLKELYRAVVRKLHPDHQPDMTSQKTEWWHEAQEAYEKGDADQLEVILTLCEIGEGGTTSQTSASVLYKITEQLKSSLRGIKRQLTKLRRDPAWNFSNKPDRDDLEDRLRLELMEEISILRDRDQQNKETIESWKAAAEKSRSKPKPKPKTKPKQPAKPQPQAQPTQQGQAQAKSKAKAEPVSDNLEFLF